jgi:hypothetical protein
VVWDVFASTGAVGTARAAIEKEDRAYTPHLKPSFANGIISEKDCGEFFAGIIPSRNDPTDLSAPIQFSNSKDASSPLAAQCARVVHESLARQKACLKSAGFLPADFMAVVVGPRWGAG